jgi:hypothetical protein
VNLFFELSGSLVQYIGMRNITENKFSKQIKYGMIKRADNGRSGPVHIKENVKI